MKDHTDKLAHALGTTLTVLCALFMRPIYADHPISSEKTCVYFELINNTDMPMHFDKVATRVFMGSRDTISADTQEATYTIPPQSSKRIAVRWYFIPYHGYETTLRGEIPWSDVMPATSSYDLREQFMEKLAFCKKIQLRRDDTFRYTVHRNPENNALYYEILRPESSYESPERIATREKSEGWQARQRFAAAQKALNQPFYEAAETGDLKKAKKLLADHPNININRQLTWANPLLISIHNNKKDMLKFLVARGADLNCVFGDKTALNEAVWKNLPDTVKILLNGGANVNLKNSERGATALHYAVEEGNKNIVKILLDAGADVYAQDKAGKTTFDYLKKSSKNERAIRKLLDDAAKKQKTS